MFSEMSAQYADTDDNELMTESKINTLTQPQTRTRRVLNRGCNILCSIPGLLVLLILYTLIGAGIFYSIESANEAESRRNITSAKSTFLEQAWNLSRLDGIDFKNWSAEVKAELERYVDVSIHERYYVETDDVTWTFMSALTYVSTIYTTIGYGHMTPATVAGKVLTVFYANFGIPLCFILVAKLGILFTRVFKFLWSFIRKCYYTRCSMGQRLNEDFNLPIPVAFLILNVYVLAGAGLYTVWEKDWDYRTGLYFVFISITTIGFGDFSPSSGDFYFMLSSMYVFFGIAIVAMFVKVVMDNFSLTLCKSGQPVIDMTGK